MPWFKASPSSATISHIKWQRIWRLINCPFVNFVNGSLISIGVHIIGTIYKTNFYYVLEKSAKTYKSLFLCNDNLVRDFVICCMDTSSSLRNIGIQTLLPCRRVHECNLWTIHCSWLEWKWRKVEWNSSWLSFWSNVTTLLMMRAILANDVLRGD